MVTVESPETEEFVVFSCARGGDSLSRVRTLVEVSSREGDEPTVVLGRGLIVGGKLGVVPRLTWCLSPSTKGSTRGGKILGGEANAHRCFLKTCRARTVEPGDLLFTYLLSRSRLGCF